MWNYVGTKKVHSMFIPVVWFPHLQFDIRVNAFEIRALQSPKWEFGTRWHCVILSQDILIISLRIGNKYKNVTALKQ
jgi:hypothetical protein